jgi:predicted PurR-regulated permease PerM
MAPRMDKNTRGNSVLAGLLITTLVVVALHFGRPVVMPIALAILFSFLFSPLVEALCRAKFRRGLAVGLVVVLMFSIFGGIIFGLARQMTMLASELPKYKDNIHQKIVDLRSAGKGSPFHQIQLAIRDLRGEFKRHETQEKQTNAPPSLGEPTPIPDEKPMKVVVQAEKPITSAWPTALGSVFEVMATAFLVVVLVIFMLLRSRQLRNRIILFVGSERMSMTTRALDEASARISRYLVMQTIVNTTFGLCVGVGLYFIGLPYALLWGFLAGLLRFIPYVGPWLGTTMPVILSLAVFPGWMHPFLIIGLFVVLELTINMAMEPLLYGHTAGVSEVALLISVAFWTWVWGPIGLALATPLTVCVVVLGKYVPGLSFVQLLMGDEPDIEPHILLYQRILAGDKTEAEEIVHSYAKKHSLVEVYDKLLIPVLISAKRDQLQETLSDSNLSFLLSTVSQLTEKSPSWMKRNVIPKHEDRELLLAAPAQGAFDELALEMLRNVLAPRLDVEILSSETLSGEMIQEAARRKPVVVLVGSVSPGGEAECRYLCKRFGSAFGTGLKVMLGRFGADKEQTAELLESSSADVVATSMAEAKNQILQLAQLETDDVEGSGEPIRSEALPEMAMDSQPAPSHPCV